MGIFGGLDDFPKSRNAGAKNHKAKLTDKKVKAIRKFLAKWSTAKHSLKVTVMAKKYGVSYSAIVRIEKRETWRVLK